MAKTTQLRRAFSQLDISKQDQDYLIPAILGFLINGVRTVDVPNRPGYVYVRVRSNLNEVIQVFNDRVAPVYDLPVLMIRDPNNPTRYKIEGRDVGRYDNWGTSAPFLASHGNTHSFDPAGRGGGDVTWVYSQQIMPWNVIPSGTYGSGNVLISGYPRYTDAWDFAGNTGTSSLLSYKPTGSSARMVLVYMDADNNPRLTIGSLFSAAYSGTYAVMPYIPAPPTGTSTIPLAAVRLDANTTTIMWDDIIDLRPFFTGGGGGGSSSSVNGGTGTVSVYRDGILIDASVTAFNFIGANIVNNGADRVDVTIPHKGNFIRHWDQSASAFVYYTGTTSGLTSALANVGSGDVLYLPDVAFSPVSGSVTNTGFAMIGVAKSTTGQGTSIEGLHLGPLLTFSGGGINTYLKDIYFNITASNHSGTACAIDASFGTLFLDNVHVRAYNNGSGSAVAIRNADNAVFLGGVIAEARSTVLGYQYPPITKSDGSMVLGSYTAVLSDGYAQVTQRQRSGLPASYIDMGITGTLSFVGAGGIRIPRNTSNTANPPTSAQITSAFGSPSGSGAGFLALMDDNGAGANEYLVVSDGTNWFYSTLTKAV